MFRNWLTSLIRISSGLLLTINAGCTVMGQEKDVIGLGNGVFINSEGLIATVDHLAECSSIEVQSIDQPRTPAIVVRHGDYHTGFDVAILSIGRPSPNYVSMDLERATRYFNDISFDHNRLQVITYRMQDEIGKPTYVATTLLGVVNLPNSTPEWKPDWVIGNRSLSELSHGTSGSPVLTSDNRVIGLIVGDFFEKSIPINEGTVSVVPSLFFRSLDDRVASSGLKGAGRPEDAVVRIFCHSPRVLKSS